MFVGSLLVQTLGHVHLEFILTVRLKTWPISDYLISRTVILVRDFVGRTSSISIVC